MRIKKLLLLFILSLFSFSLFSCTEREEQNVIYKEGLVDTELEAFNKDARLKAIDSSVALVDFYEGSYSIGSGTIFKAISNGEELTGQLDLSTPRDVTLYILTNQHVATPVEGSTLNRRACLFTSSDTEYTSIFEAVKVNQDKDVAVVKTTINTSLLSGAGRGIYVQEILNGNFSKKLYRSGSFAFSCGSPNEYKNFPRITRGIISSHDETYYFHDVTINHGNSGGGLYDAYTGFIIGITSAGIVKVNNKDLVPQEIGISIQISLAINVVKDFNINYV